MSAPSSICRCRCRAAAPWPCSSKNFATRPTAAPTHPSRSCARLVGASLKAYRAGPNTRAWRERIIVDYLNTVPLAAAPGYGEIHGLGEALFAWFGMRLDQAAAALNEPGRTPAKVRAFKYILTLLISVRAPSVFLVDERDSLEEKVDQFTRLMARAGLIDWELAAQVQDMPIRFLPAAPLPPQPSSSRNKAANAIRTNMMDALGVTNLYDLNRLHLQVDSTFDVSLQKQVTEFLNRLADPNFIKAHGLNGERLLENADPAKVIYSFLLLEATPSGNLIRVQADNFAAPFDFNKSVKLELGSTAKLRTLTHYLEVMAALYGELAGLDNKQLGQRAQSARDPLTKWAIETVRNEKLPDLQSFLDLAMERRYSASPYEEFFTGGGLHHFDNFEKEDNARILPLRDAFRNSVNLVFIRLMRDLVSYHRARLPYDYENVLENPTNPVRMKMLEEIAEEESRQALRRAYQNYAKQTPEQIVGRLVGTKKNPARRATILFFAWRIGKSESDLEAWLKKNQVPTKDVDIVKLFHAYDNPRLTITDYAYLLALHPLDLWCASEFRNDPNLSWKNFGLRAATRAAWVQPGCSAAATGALRICVCASAWKKTPSAA